MSQQHEYTKPMSSGAPCTYANLQCYNQGAQMAPAPKGGDVRKYVVPKYAAIGYDALTHGGAGSCGGYFNIQSAYGKGAGKCNQSYVTSLCGSCNK